MSRVESVLPWDASKFSIAFIFFTVDYINANIWQQLCIDGELYKLATVLLLVQARIWHIMNGICLRMDCGSSSQLLILGFGECYQTTHLLT